MKKRSAPPLPVQELPVYWFSILDQAIQQGDLELGAQAQRELERLGVHVAYKLRRGRPAHPCERRPGPPPAAAP
jgi:hypothetical protein